jgi:hypothetical protein
MVYQSYYSIMIDRTFDRIFTVSSLIDQTNALGLIGCSIDQSNTLGLIRSSIDPMILS